MASFSDLKEKKKYFWPAQWLKNGIVNTKIIWLGVIGGTLLIVGGLLETPQKAATDNSTPLAQQAIQINKTYEEYLENKLTNLLVQVKGAGSIAVNVTLENSARQEFEKNITKESKVIQEKDTAGGNRITNEIKEISQVLVTKENGIDHPVVVQEVKPSIKGVVVIAEGALDSQVKANLTRAVEAGLGIPSYKITVLPQRK